ncbi:hypothetical protein RY27_18755 [Litorilinea aerophila]|nr:hypothetical protein RY27_18755 [Litorilinea aerophila]
MRKPWYAYLYIKSPITKITLGILSVLIAIVVILFIGLFEEPRMEAQTRNWEGRQIEKGAEIFANNCSSCHGPDGKGLPNVAPALHSRYFFTQRLNDIGWAGSLHDYVALTVAAGRPSKVNTQWAQIMPTWSNRFGGPLRDDQIEQVTAYVLNWEEDALQQTPEEDPWQFFQDAPSKAEGAQEQAPAEQAAQDESAGPRPPQELFVTYGCAGCHNLDEPQTDTNRGPVGPNLGNLHEVAGEMVPGQDAETYVYTSIVDPNAFIVPGYNANIMPQNFADQMSEEEIRGLVQWLLDPNRQR